MRNIPKITEAELKVMEKIWEKSNINAKEMVILMEQEEGWNKNTTYTVLNRLISKKAIERREPSFVCLPLVSIEEIRITETKKLLEKLYGGSLKMLLTGFLNSEELSGKEWSEIKEIIDCADDQNSK